MDQDNEQHGTISVDGSSPYGLQVPTGKKDDAAEFKKASTTVSSDGEEGDEPESAGDDGDNYGTMSVDGDETPNRKVSAEQAVEDDEEAEDASEDADEPDVDEDEDEEEPEPEPKAKGKPQQTAAVVDENGDEVVSAAAMEEFADIVGKDVTDKVLKPLVDAVKRLTAESRQTQTREYDRLVHQTIDKLNDPKLGTDFTDVTKEQAKRREKIKETAEKLWAKAQDAGKPISGKQAITLAHQKVMNPKPTPGTPTKILTRTDQRGNKVIKQRVTSPVASRPSGAGTKEKTYRGAAAKLDRMLENLRG
jgi:hypothetical protein